MSSATFQSSTQGLVFAAIKAKRNNANEWESLWTASLTEPKRKLSIYASTVRLLKSSEHKDSQQLPVITVPREYYWPHTGLLGHIMPCTEK